MIIVKVGNENIAYLAQILADDTQRVKRMRAAIDQHIFTDQHC
jgi:hypothetical protein